MSEPSRPRTRSTVLLGAVVGVLVAGAAIAATRSGPRPASTQPSAPPVAVASPTSRPLPSPTRRPVPTSRPAPSPTPTPSCDLPDTLTATPAPVATPVVEDLAVAAVFVSPTYRRDATGALVTRDDPSDWEHGLWHVAPGSPIRLLAATEHGLVRPLAISRDGTKAAVWWLPAQRPLGEAPCPSGIYLVSLVDASSYLFRTGDWSDDDDDSEALRWYDPPSVEFSADGRYLSLHDRMSTTLVALDTDREAYVHGGSCPRWAWSATGNEFVAGCEDMTTAWLVHPEDGFTGESFAIPMSRAARQLFDDESTGRDIGLTADGEIRVVRFHGYATGCESPDCTLPPLGYSVTTIEPTSGTVEHHVAELERLVDGTRDHAAWLSADASWAYSPNAGEDGHIVRFEPTSVRDVSKVGTLLGDASDGSAIYALADDTAGVPLRVIAIDSDGETRPVLTLSRPVGARAWTDEGTFQSLVLAGPR